MTAGVPLWSKTAASNATADPAVNWAEGQAPSTVNDSSRGEMASVAKWRDDLYGLTTAGTGTAYTVTTNASYSSASDMSGAVFTIVPNATSGAAPTLAVDGLTARAINVSTGVAIPTGALIAGTPYLVKYVHATTEFILLGAAGKTLLAALDIIGGTSEATIAVGDTLAIYDLSNTGNRRMLVSDFLKVVNALTEDSTPDSALDFVMSYDASATAAKKVKLSNLPSSLPRGYIDGCILSNGTDATNDINIAAGVCRDSTNTVDITVPALSGKQLDANWAAGAAAGMRNSAAGITNTTYHIYAVRTAASATADIYAHTSTTVATVLTALQAESGGTNYIYARRIGSILRVSNAIVGFVQEGDLFLRKAISTDTDTSNTTSAVLFTLSVPSGIKVRAYGDFSWSAAANNNIMFNSPDQDDQAPSAGSIGQFATNGTVFMWGPVQTNTSAQIRVRTSATSATNTIHVYGWFDTRGRA